MSNMFDMNDAEPMQERGILPDKTYCKLKMHIRPGDTQGPEPSEGLILKASKDGSFLMLDCEFTVLHGPHAKRKMWQTLGVQGGKVDDKGISIAWNITKSMLRSMVDSALGLAPDDVSDAAKQQRMFKGFRDLDGIEFAARVDVAPGGDNPNGGKYPDKNVIGAILTVKDSQYQAIMNGTPIMPQAGPAATGAAAPSRPAWQKDAPAAAVAPAAQSSATKKPAWLNS